VAGILGPWETMTSSPPKIEKSLKKRGYTGREAEGGHNWPFRTHSRRRDAHEIFDVVEVPSYLRRASLTGFGQMKWGPITFLK